MASEKQTDKAKVYSKLSGYNTYTVSDRPSVFGNVPEHIRITDIRSTRDYRADLLAQSDQRISDSYADWFSGIILNPVSNAFFEWPVDLIELGEAGKYARYLVFKNRKFGSLQPIKDLLYQPGMSDQLDWRRPLIRSICRSILHAMMELQENGYIYNNFNMQNIFYHPETGEVFFKFTPLIRIAGSRTEFDTVDCGAVSTEFAPPYIYNPDVYNGMLTRKSDYYQVSALLFRLMIGKLPYEGRDLAGYGVVFHPQFDTDEMAHNYYFKHYHQYPHFIFDENDDTNALSVTSDNDLPRERWNTLPESIKYMFRETLRQKTAEDPSSQISSTLRAWLEQIKNLDSAAETK